MPKTFVLNDQSKLNSHGFFLHNAGGNFERFDANPVMLDNHHMERLCGKWVNRRIEGDLLLADADFDEGDTLGAERKGQADRGYLNGASLGIRVTMAEMCGEELHVTQWEPFEASVTPIPSNAGALQLKVYNDTGELVKDQDMKKYLNGIVQLCASKKTNKQQIQKTMEKSLLTAEAFTTLGLSVDATAEATSAAIVALAAQNTEYKQQLDEQVKQKAESLVDLAVADGRITADRREAFVKLATADYESTKVSLEGIPAKQTLSTQVAAISNSVVPEDRKDWGLYQWLKEDEEGLGKIKLKHPEVYEEIRQKEQQ